MSKNYGKDFEEKFKSDWLEIPNATIDRLYDTMNGYKSISQISDFIGYIFPNIFYLECKVHEGNTFPFSNLTQYDKLLTKVNIPGVRTGVVLWMIDHDVIVYLPISSIYKMKQDNKKSFNIKMLQTNEYKIITIPTSKKRVFLKANYSILKELNEGD